MTEGVAAPLKVQGGSLELTNWELRRALEEAAVYPAGDSARSWVVKFGWGAVTADPQANIVGDSARASG